MKKITLLLFLFTGFITSALQAQSPPPPGYQGIITLCERETLNLTAPSSFQAQTIVAYRWFRTSSYTTTLSTVQNPSFPNMTTAQADEYNAEFLYQDGSSSSVPYTYFVVVNPSPATPSTANNSPMCSGSALSLTASSISGASYHWTGPNGFTSTLQNPTIADATAAHTGTYSVAVASAINGCSSLPGTTAVTINAQTSNTTTAAVVGSYAWVVTGETYTETGIHTIVSGCHTEILDLTINEAEVTAQPSSTIICSTVGSTASFTVSTTMPNAVYSWQYRKVSAAIPNQAWTTITGANAGTVYSGYTSATLGVTKTATLPAIGTEFRVVISGDVPALTSDTATITILSTAKAGTISVPTSVCLGNDITFTVTKYSGTSFQWQSAPNATGTFADIPGATETSYTIVGATADVDKSYRVVVTNSCTGSTATSAIKTIKVDPVSVAGTITGGGLVCAGSNATIRAAGYVGKIQWQYSKDGSEYIDAPKAADAPLALFGTTSTSSTGASYMVTGIADGLYFRAKITSGACSSVYTPSVHYTLGTTAIVGTASTESATVCPATPTTLTLSNATGTITWQKSTNYNSASPAWIPMANSNTLTISSGNIAYNTAFRAKVSLGACSTVYSNLVYVSPVAKPMAKPIVKSTTSPTGNTAATALCAMSNSKILTAGAGTVGDIHWQWSQTSATTGFVDTGATGSNYTLTFPNYINYTNNNGINYYRMRITNSCGAEVFGAAVTVYFKACGNEPGGSGTDWLKTKAFDVTAYPNPSTESFNVSLTASSVETARITIYDMTGKLIDKLEVNPSDRTNVQVGSRYTSGIYNIVVTQGSDVKTLRVIKL